MDFIDFVQAIFTARNEFMILNSIFEFLNGTFGYFFWKVHSDIFAWLLNFTVLDRSFLL